MIKRILIAILCLLFLFASQGPLTPGTVVDGGGDVTFDNPDNAKVEDGVSTTATATSVVGGVKATNFSFSIPVGSTINGVLAEWKSSSTEATSSNDIQALVVNGSETSAPDGGSNNDNLTGTLTFYSVGGATNTWQGSLPTVTEANASGFGVSVYEAFGTVEATISIDVIRVTVFYTPASSIVGKHLIGLLYKQIGETGKNTTTEVFAFDSWITTEEYSQELNF